DAERSNLYYARVFPPARPPVLDTVKRGLVRHEAGLPRARRVVGVGAHAARVAKCWPWRTTPETGCPWLRTGVAVLLLRPVRAAEHPAQPLVQRVADLVQRADPVYGGAVGRWQPVRLRVVEAAPDVADRDQLDPVGVDEPQAPVGGDHDPVEEVQPGYFEHVFERADLPARPGQHRRSRHGGPVGNSRIGLHTAPSPPRCDSAVRGVLTRLRRDAPRSGKHQVNVLERGLRVSPPRGPPPRPGPRPGRRPADPSSGRRKAP